MGTLPRPFPLLAQRQRRIAHLRLGRRLRIEFHDAHDEIVQVGVEVRDDGPGLHADSANEQARERAHTMNIENAVGDLCIEPLFLGANAHVIVVLARAAGWRAGARHHLSLL